MTKAELAEWLEHPVTVELFKTIENAKLSAIETPIVNVDDVYYKDYTSDAVAIRAAARDGFIAGISALEDAYNMEVYA